MIDQKEIYSFYLYSRTYSEFQKEKKYINGQELWLKVKIDQEQYKNTIG